MTWWDDVSAWIAENANDIGHGVLDGVGLIPVLGEPADVANAVWYAIEGKYLDAGLSLISIIPVVGDIIGKGGKLAIKLGPEAAKKVLQLLRKIDISGFLAKFKKHPKLGPHVEKIEKALKEWMDDLEKKFDDKPAGKAKEPCPIETSSKLTPGAERAARHGAKWQRGSLKETVERIAGPNPIIETTASGKKIFRNPETGLQVVHDVSGNYFRVENPAATGIGRYLDLNGNQIPANVPVIGQSGKVTQTGVPPDVRKALTHFLNGD